MVPFLRKIRKSLLAKSSLGRYALYAIGEILLVVVGILLALQINNWNEDRQRREIEMKTLRDLKVEFTENLNDALRVYDFTLTHYDLKRTLQGMEALPERQAYDAETLLGDPVFMSHVSTKKMHAVHNAMECQRVVESCEEILELIENELLEQTKP